MPKIPQLPPIHCPECDIEFAHSILIIDNAHSRIVLEGECPQHGQAYRDIYEWAGRGELKAETYVDHLDMAGIVAKEGE